MRLFGWPSSHRARDALAVGGPREDTASRRPSAGQGERPPRNQPCRHPDLGAPASATKGREASLLKPRGCGVLLRQPEQTGADTYMNVWRIPFQNRNGDRRWWGHDDCRLLTELLLLSFSTNLCYVFNTRTYKLNVNIEEESPHTCQNGCHQKEHKWGLPWGSSG